MTNFMVFKTITSFLEFYVTYKTLIQKGILLEPVVKINCYIQNIDFWRTIP